MISHKVDILYLLLDGAFGNNNALQMSRRCGLHLISKLRFDAALYLSYDAPQKKPGMDRKYGEKVTPHHIDDNYLVSQLREEEFETRIYGFQAWSKNFPDLLNIALIQRINHKTNKICHVILFSSDLDLDTQELVDLGFDIYLDSNSLVLIEWPELAMPLLPQNTVKMTIPINSDDSRSLSFER